MWQEDDFSLIPKKTFITIGGYPFEREPAQKQFHGRVKGIHFVQDDPRPIPRNEKTCNRSVVNDNVVSLNYVSKIYLTIISLFYFFNYLFMYTFFYHFAIYLSFFLLNIFLSTHRHSSTFKKPSYSILSNQAYFPFLQMSHYKRFK